MTSKLVVNTIEADTGISSVSFASSISMSSTSVFHFSDAGVNIGADTNISRLGNGILGFNINGAEKARIDSSGHIKVVGVVTATHFYGSGANLTGITGTTINNNADNRVITGSGTANTLEAESTLTYNGNRLFAPSISATDNGAGSPLLSLRQDDQNPWAFEIGNDTYGTGTNGLMGYVENGGDMLIRYRGDSAYKSLTIEQHNGSSNRSWMTLGNGGNVVLKYQGATKIETTSSGLKVTAANSSSTAFQLYNTDSSANVWYVNGEGNGFFRHTYPLTDSNLDLGYHASNKWRDVVLSGGIRYGNATDANYLDDYEEGSYVVTVTGSSSGSFALNPNSFRYTKIGRVVHVSGRFYIVSGSPTGSEARISLPFTAAAHNQSQDGSAYSYVTTYNAYSPNNDYQMANSVISGNAYSVLIWVVPNAAWQTVSPSSHLNQRNAYYCFDFSYTTAT